jgi:hypothetical protein
MGGAAGTMAAFSGQSRSYTTASELRRGGAHRCAAKPPRLREPE